MLSHNRSWRIAPAQLLAAHDWIFPATYRQCCLQFQGTAGAEIREST